jgi:hypothetical protein
MIFIDILIYFYVTICAVLSGINLTEYVAD